MLIRIFMGRKIQDSILVPGIWLAYLPLELRFNASSLSEILLNFHCPESNVKFLFPHKPLRSIFLISSSKR